MYMPSLRINIEYYKNITLREFDKKGNYQYLCGIYHTSDTKISAEPNKVYDESVLTYVSEIPVALRLQIFYGLSQEAGR